MHLDAERRAPGTEFGALDHPARPRPGVAEFDAQFTVAGDLPRPIGDQPVQGMRPVVGGALVLGADWWLAALKVRSERAAGKD